MVIEYIVQHKHCINCSRAIPADKQYCSDNCKEEYTKALQRKKMLVYINYAAILVMVMIFVVVSS